MVSIGRAAMVTAALMFLTGAAVYAIGEALDDPSPNEVDIGFAEDMPTHHLQGVQMALAYLEDGTDDYLRAAAEEIILVQAGESRLLGQALQDWGSPEVDTETAMEWMGMPVPQLQQPGMASEEDLAALDAATGDELDDLFSRLMVEHHRGGIHMADFAADHGSEAIVRDLGTAMGATQRSEIAELNLRREQLGLEPA